MSHAATGVLGFRIGASPSPSCDRAAEGPRACGLVARLDVVVAERRPTEAVERASGEGRRRANLDDLHRAAVTPSDRVEDGRSDARVRNERAQSLERGVCGVRLAQIPIDPLLIPCAG